MGARTSRAMAVAASAVAGLSRGRFRVVSPEPHVIERWLCCSPGRALTLNSVSGTPVTCGPRSSHPPVLLGRRQIGAQTRPNRVLPAGASVGCIAPSSPPQPPPGRSFTATCACAASTASAANRTWLVLTRMASKRCNRATRSCKNSKGNPISAITAAAIDAQILEHWMVRFEIAQRLKHRRGPDRANLPSVYNVA